MPTYWSFLIVRAMYALGTECNKIYVDNSPYFQANLHLPQLRPVSWEIYSQTRPVLWSMVYSTWVSRWQVFRLIISTLNTQPFRLAVVSVLYLVELQQSGGGVKS